MSIQPIVKGYFSSDVENLATWNPTSPQDVYYPLELSIGTEGEDRADIFQVVVATPEAIRSRLMAKAKCVVGRHILLVAEQDWPSIKRFCESIVEKCADDTWPKVCSRLARSFRWEFEDYVEVKE
jgi:hypothetical protein